MLFRVAKPFHIILIAKGASGTVIVYITSVNFALTVQMGRTASVAAAGPVLRTALNLPPFLGHIGSVFGITAVID